MYFVILEFRGVLVGGVGCKYIQFQFLNKVFRNIILFNRLKSFLSEFKFVTLFKVVFDFYFFDIIFKIFIVELQWGLYFFLSFYLKENFFIILR